MVSAQLGRCAAVRGCLRVGRRGQLLSWEVVPAEPCSSHCPEGMPWQCTWQRSAWPACSILHAWSALQLACPGSFCAKLKEAPQQQCHAPSPRKPLPDRSRVTRLAIVPSRGTPGGHQPSLGASWPTDSGVGRHHSSVARASMPGLPWPSSLTLRLLLARFRVFSFLKTFLSEIQPSGRPPVAGWGVGASKQEQGR